MERIYTETAALNNISKALTYKQIKTSTIVKKLNIKVKAIFLGFIFIGLNGVNVSGQAVGDYRSVASGNWSTLATWQRLNALPNTWNTPTVAQGYPGQNSGTGLVETRRQDDININIVVPNSIGGLTIGYISGNGSSTITFATGGNYSLTVTGNVTTTDGNIAVANENNVTRTHTLTIGGNLIANSDGFDMTNNNDVCNVVFNGTSQTISGTGTKSFNSITFSNSGTISVNDNIADIDGTMSVGAASVINPAAGIQFNSGGAAGTISGTGKINVTRITATPNYSTQYRFTTNTLTSMTVDYSGAGNQTINIYTYGNLILSNSGTKTAQGAITVNGKTTIGGVDYGTGGFNSNLGVLSMKANSTIAMTAASHTITLGNSSAETWTGTLNITGWVSGTNHIQVGVGGLSDTQLGQVKFGTLDIGAIINNNGELFPRSAWQAQFISMNVGSPTWCTGETRTVQVTVKNVGSASWTNTSPDINIGVKWNADPDYLVRTDANGLAPGATQTYSFTVTAPSTVGPENLSFDVVNEGTCWFGNNSGTCGPGNSVFASSILTNYTSPSAITISPSSSTVCFGDIQQLTASGGTNTSTSLSIGTETNSNSSTTYPAPYGAYYESAKHQILILASELNSAGLIGACNITSLDFNVVALNNSGIHKDFTIKLANTSLTALTTAFVTTGLTTVYGPTNYQPSSGLNIHTFTTPFSWDGTSNIVVETCFSNDPTGTLGTQFTNNASTYYSTTSFSSVSWARADNLDQCSLTTASNIGTSRPNIKFGYETQSISWSPTSGLYLDPGTTIAYTGTVTLSVYAKPTSTTIFTATASSIAGCTKTSTVEIIVNPTTVAGSISGITEICSGGSVSLTLSGHTGSVVKWQSSVSPFTTWTDIANTNTSYATGALTQTTQFRAVVQSGICSSATTNAFTVNVLATGTFIGADVSNPTYWEDPDNWCGGIPTNTSDVIIPSGKNVEITATTSECNDLTIISGGSVTIKAGKALTVFGTLTNNANVGGILISSTSTSTGSLIHNTPNVRATIERFITAVSTWPTATDGWHLLSSPIWDGESIYQDINSTWAPDGLDDNDFDFYALDESKTTGYWLNQKEVSNNITKFDPGKGYLVAYQEQPSSPRTFVGPINTTSVTFSSLSNTTTSSYPGWHLVGNPFSCAIDWDLIGSSLKTNIDEIRLYWDANSASYKTSVEAGNIIPAMNGFMIHTSGNGSLTIPTSARKHVGPNWFKSDDNNYILLKASDTDRFTAQSSLIRFDSQANNGYDSQYDSYFLAGFAPMFYSISDNSNFALNTLPELTDNLSIPFGFIKNSFSNFTIELTESIPNAELTLEDKKTSTFQNLSENPVYSFSSLEGDNTNRFVLHFKNTTSINNPEATNNFSLHVDNGTITINQLVSMTGTVKVSDMLGRTIAIENMVADTPLQINLNSTPGVYVVTVYTKSKTYSQKVVIR